MTDENTQQPTEQVTPPVATFEEEKNKLYASLAALEAKVELLKIDMIAHKDSTTRTIEAFAQSVIDRANQTISELNNRLRIKENALLEWLKKIKPSHLLFVFNVVALALIAYLISEYTYWSGE